MSSISILNDDYEILFDDETVGGNAVAGMKMVRRKTTATNTVPYSTNELYSAIASASDDIQAMGFSNPMLPVTPNAYTIEDNYFIPRSTTEDLKEGAIDADWSVVSGEGVYRKVWGSGTAPVQGDIGRQVVETTSGDSGTLLDFEVEPDGLTVVWIRPDTAGDTFALSTSISCTADGGTFSSAGSSPASSGRTLYSSIQVIGSVPTATEVYLYQDRNVMTDSATNTFQWWATDPSQSLGIIDILVRVENANVSIADGDVEVFSRRYTSLYDNFRLRVNAGGRSALPLASAADINNTTGYRTVTNTGGSGTFNVGNGIYQGADWASATARGVITAVGGSGASPVLEYYLVGDLTDFTSGVTDMIEYDFATSADGDGACTDTGTPGINLGGPTDTASGEGGTVTIELGSNVTQDHDGDAVNEPYSITIDAQTNVSAAKVYERIKFVTRRGSDSSFWDTITPSDIPGETYRGIELQAQITANVAAWDEGDNVVVDATGYTARAIARNATDTYVMLTDQQSSIKTLSAADALDDEENDSVAISGTPVSITSPKSSPFGTFTGSQIFGAQGVLYVNPASADTQNYILTDDNGVQRTPPNLVAFDVNNAKIGDRIFVAKDSGAQTGVINKDRHGGLDGTDAVGSSTINVGDISDSEVPSSGFIRVVDIDLKEEHRYVYDSRDLTAETFSLKVPSDDGIVNTTDTTPDGDGFYNLNDTGAAWATGTATNAEVGMLVRNTTAGKRDQVYEVMAVVDDTNLTIRPLYGAGTGFLTTETFEINTLIGKHDDGTTPVLYNSTANCFDLIIDAESLVDGTVSNSFVQSATDFVVVNVRAGKSILPFNANPQIGSSGGSSTVVRTPDTIAV